MENLTQTLPPSQALKEGAQLWLLSDSSPWYYKIDWYLSFLISKLSSQKLPSLSEEKISSFEKKHSIPPNTLPSALTGLATPTYPTTPFLMETSSRLPNLWTVKINYHTKWLTQGRDIWYHLNKPTLRVFLPKETTFKIWENEQDENRVQYIR